MIFFPVQVIHKPEQPFYLRDFSAPEPFSTVSHSLIFHILVD